MRKVYLCKGCIDELQYEYGDNLGYDEPVEVCEVPQEECDNTVISTDPLTFRSELREINSQED